MSDQSNMNSVLDEIKTDLTTEENTTRTFTMVGGGLAGFLCLYLLWLNVQINQFFDPEALSDATAGAAIEAAPDVSSQLRLVIVDGAPDIARALSTSAVDLIPNYRELLEEEMRPVIDEVARVLASTAVSKIAEASGTKGADGEASAGAQAVLEGKALQAAADEVMNRLDYVLEEALDTPTEADGPTPRQTIETAQEQLINIDRGLDMLMRKRGDPRERELVMAWLSLLDGYQEAQDLSDKETHKAEAKKAAGKAAGKAPAGKAPGKAPAGK